jgi:hypothetical protein
MAVVKVKSHMRNGTKVMGHTRDCGGSSMGKRGWSDPEQFAKRKNADKAIRSNHSNMDSYIEAARNMDSGKKLKAMKKIRTSKKRISKMVA